ncbi:hypothetical protein EMIHUDRAFT_224500 [Emiliania huxleyi CCMP1516]|uniref:Nucleoside diphosphate kinase-like domain-containing protein n=2 Tax=Emiliania huxleyi TaxID=2903 RepID=A0A0D3J1W5_EMIH1|nr:hypothetical protein EMIHUDRAFT_244103 [Emiliania huxleyi CCMP1516]XP_005790864.1 hypothetical protein EMIHUDRAFT_224500 [Emiliania huxleyi CCMP1516]EOD17500.1 hypothetical protein EMIHUDRAFT_244103 [Emiliania huxleyi CCMP1516]EOD38435.1 hypothetical protein EMIHUDRAFT_224500 [Emiliania huxleyi CCMP1516]|eukprot:XP_005769929.1 hypothetical protein EMIHUDRAFT_244103 [Emiliania huxleyi CCMP1516]
MLYVHLSGGQLIQLIREALAKSGYCVGNVLLSKPSAEMACLQEWDADRRQAAHAEKSLAVRELVHLSLRAKSTGVVAELHLDTALVAPSGSGADHERQIRGDARQQIGVAS